MNRNVLLGLAAGLVFSCVALVALGAGEDKNAQEKGGSVLVETKPVQQGAIADTLTAYGTVAPAINGGMTLSVQAEGRVMRIAVTPGEAVHAGQALIEFHLSSAASSTYSQAVSALKLTREEQVRVTRLLGQQLATRDQQAQADKAASDAQAALDALEHETGGKPQQTLVAPFDGVVSAVPVAQGDRVAAGAPLVTITRSNGLVVTVGVEPSEAKRVKLGQTVRLKSLSGDADAVEGKLSRIDKSLNPRTRLVDADVAIPDELIQGEAYRAQIVVGELKGWLVPRDAVLDDEEGANVYQVAGDKAKRVKVKRVGSDDETAVVEGPIDATLEVVLAGNYQLEDGAAVRAQEGKADDAKDSKSAGDDTTGKHDAPAKDAKSVPATSAGRKQP
jgi:RND family efflux transporter MFP subunit